MRSLLIFLLHFAVIFYSNTLQKARRLTKRESNMDNKERFELNDDELDNVVGGISVGDRVLVNTRTVRYCPNCAKLPIKYTGTAVGKTYYENGGHYFIDVK